MNARERYRATIRCQPVDRLFRQEMGWWAATETRWRGEGLPANWRELDYFEFDQHKSLPIDLGWCDSPFYPAIEQRVLEEDDDTRVVRDRSGIVKRVLKHQPETSMPQFLRFPVETRRDWEELAPLLEPQLDARLAGLAECTAACGGWDNRSYPVRQNIVGVWMHLRNLFGDERLCLALYDDPALVKEIIAGWVRLMKGSVGRILEHIDLDVLAIAEDIAYKSGPLISPRLFREFITPAYRELIGFAKERCDLRVLVDSDGNVEQLIPVFLEAGVDILLPFEVQAGSDVVDVKRRYGDQLVIFGGIDKRALAEDFATIEREVARVVPFLAGHRGYMPMLDHTVPPNVPLRNFEHYLAVVRSYEPR